jgi:hypothetical protein
MMRISWVERVTNEEKSLEDMERKEACGRILLREEVN